jgi:hypothetical protein
LRWNHANEVKQALRTENGQIVIEERGTGKTTAIKSAHMQ